MASFRFTVLDVFTDTALAGNQLAVFTDARDIPEPMLQPLAREIGFSETVFVFRAEGDGHARMRIFTPAVELPFAGHPILGTAFVLASPLQLIEIRLETPRALVPVLLERDEGGRIVFGRMSQPLPTIDPYGEQEALLRALGLERSELPIEVYDNGAQHVYVGLESPEAVAALQPDLRQLASFPDVGVNCFAGSGSEWKTRMFALGLGVSEDAATGSAAGPLALHLARHGRIRFGEEITISQGAEIMRPSTLYASVEGSVEDIRRVEVGGCAVIVARGDFHLT